MNARETLSAIVPTTTLVAALGAGLIAGVFFAFSTFVMPALARLPAAQGIAAMQSINITVMNRWFLAAFMGTTLVCLAVIVQSCFSIREVHSWLRIAGALFFLIGTFLVTGGYHIPRNDALMTVVPDSIEGARFWEQYLVEWCRMNHVRTVTAFLASTALAIAYRLGH